MCALFTEQLRHDAELLKELQAMDYLLLVDVHNIRHGNSDNVHRNTLRVFLLVLPEVRMPLQRLTHGPLHRRRTAMTSAEQLHVVRHAVLWKVNLKQIGEGFLPGEYHESPWPRPAAAVDWPSPCETAVR